MARLKPRGDPARPGFEPGDQVTASRKPRRCRACGSRTIASILFGMPAPSADLQRDLDAGVVVLGGCMVTEDDPAWRCAACGVPIYKTSKTAAELELHDVSATSVPVQTPADKRRDRRASWPVRRFRLGEEPGEDLSSTTTVEDRLAMMWPLALDAFSVVPSRSDRTSRARWPVKVRRLGEAEVD